MLVIQQTVGVAEGWPRMVPRAADSHLLYHMQYDMLLANCSERESSCFCDRTEGDCTTDTSSCQPKVAAKR